MYVNYGCGFCAPPDWRNYDGSPSLIVQNNFFLNAVLGRFLRTRFPENVVFGDILKGLPGCTENACSGVYCSHVLEHLSLEDFRLALKNTFHILKPGGIFRCVVPDLEHNARTYLQQLDEGRPDASLIFLQDALLGQLKSNRSWKDKFVALFISDRHQWMWDAHSMAAELAEAGFSEIRLATFNDCEDPHFKSVEQEFRFVHAVAMEARKPVR